MGLPVPPCFVAYDSKQGQSGALIEWFLDQTDNISYEVYAPGGDYFQQYIPEFDRKKGKQHNFQQVVKIFSDFADELSGFLVDWKLYWAKMFTFDCANW